MSCHPHALVNTSPSLALGSRVDFRAKIGRGGSTLREEAGEDWLDEGSEYDLGAACLGKSHPQDKDEFEGVVESCEVLVARIEYGYGKVIRNQYTALMALSSTVKNA
jgi:hypothetical protein